MLSGKLLHPIFVSVFHRILDFKAGLDFYLGPFFIFSTSCFLITNLLYPACCITPSRVVKTFFSACK